MGNTLEKEVKKYKHEEEVDLSKRGLKELPPAIKKCKKLIRLMVNGNQLVELPPEVGMLFCSFFTQ